MGKILDGQGQVTLKRTVRSCQKLNSSESLCLCYLHQIKSEDAIVLTTLSERKSVLKGE